MIPQALVFHRLLIVPAAGYIFSLLFTLTLVIPAVSDAW